MARTSLLPIFVAVVVTSMGVTAAHRDVQSPATASFATLLDQYRHGDADAAVSAFAAWDEGRVEAAARLPVDANDPWSLTTLIAFHTEAGVRNGTFGKIADDVRILTGTVGDRDAHYRTAAALIERIVRSCADKRDARVAGFEREWRMVAASNTGLAFQLRTGRDQFTSPAPMLLVRAALEMQGFEHADVRMAAHIGTSTSFRSIVSPPYTSSHGRFPRAEVIDIESSLRKAITLDPTLIEARLRLGRLLYLLDRNNDAKAELERTSGDAASKHDRFVGYLATLFLGQLYEREKQRDVAERSYQAAIAENPSASSARLAERLRSQSANNPARGVVAAAVPDDDPWAIYQRGAARQAEFSLKTMRALVRE